MRFTPGLILFLLVILGACSKSRDGENNCNGNTRRDVKIIVDNAKYEIDTTVNKISIEEFGKLDVPEIDSDSERQDIEKKVYQITGIIDKVKRYKDGDYHIRLMDENENYVITEVPNPNCTYAVSSDYVNTYKNLVNFVETNHLEEGDSLTITGVAFIDIDHHYPRKQAKNNLELHPILKLVKH